MSSVSLYVSSDEANTTWARGRQARALATLAPNAMKLSLALVALWAPAAHCWAAAQLHAPAHSSLQLRARRSVQPRACDAGMPEMTEADLERRVRRSDLDVAAAGAATGAEISDDDKTEGIPNYLLRFSGTVDRLAEAPDGASAVSDDGVAYELDREVRILTTDVIEMVQQQGGAAEKVDYLGENILVTGMLFDDFAAGDTLTIAPPDAAEGAGALTLEIVAQGEASALELGQLGDDDKRKASIRMLLGPTLTLTLTLTLALTLTPTPTLSRRASP